VLSWSRRGGARLRRSARPANPRNKALVPGRAVWRRPPHPAFAPAETASLIDPACSLVDRSLPGACNPARNGVAGGAGAL